MSQLREIKMVCRERRLTCPLPILFAVPVVCGSLPDIYVEKLLGFVASCLEKSGHLQFYMTWAQNLLMLHGQKLKNRSAPRLLLLSSQAWATVLVNDGVCSCGHRSGAILPALQALQKSIQRHADNLSRL